jgi:hypothetical protein
VTGLDLWPSQFQLAFFLIVILRNFFVATTFEAMSRRYLPLLLMM